MAARPYPMDPSRIKANARIGVLKAVKGKRNPAGPFADLTWEQQRAAEKWLFKFCAKWGNDLPPWRRGILTGVARRLAKNPPAADWHLRLYSHYGARVLADRCKAQGIPHPRIVAMHRGLKWKRAGRPALPAGQIAA